MFTLTTASSHSQEIKRSRFLAIAGPVADEQAAKDFIAEHSAADANHNCWAWRMGQNYRFNDDGEPSGTAGKPILQAIDGQELDCVVVVVTRWFGGVLLGSGGLIRAYGGTAALCLQAAEKIKIVPMTSVGIEAQFSDLALLKARLAASPGTSITAEQFISTGAVLTLNIPTANADDILQMVTDLTSGRAVIDRS
ncbi:YigZ family protein [Rhizobium lusitanum]|uniref:Putative YigZ family protein n=1 Tax=Rhizobium lusitanum TaxID=293958 RepID=A0A7X0IR26_9HYPH|nr:YigZ family protein [Rhizobium lusitanum]MBB6485591.1 putative YigZ family protein [Rhizobium lusitanum]